MSVILPALIVLIVSEFHNWGMIQYFVALFKDYLG